MSKIKWSKRKLKALEGSIEKWEKIVDGTGIDARDNNCPLCKLYRRCKSCPVVDTINYSGCHGTPWIEWCKHHIEEHPTKTFISSMKVECPTCKRLAHKELNFLKSILPKEGQK